MDFIGNLFLFSAVKEFWKTVRNWQSYYHEFGVLLFATQCTPLITSVCCHTTLRNAEVWIYGNLQKQSKNHVIFWQKLNRLLLHGWVLSHLLLKMFAFCLHMCTKASIALQVETRSRQVIDWSGQCHAKHAANTASIHNTCLRNIVWFYKECLTGTENCNDK